MLLLTKETEHLENIYPGVHATRSEVFISRLNSYYARMEKKQNHTTQDPIELYDLSETGLWRFYNKINKEKRETTHTLDNTIYEGRFADAIYEFASKFPHEANSPDFGYVTKIKVKKLWQACDGDYTER